MNRIASLVLVILGVVLLAWSWDAYRSVSSDISRALTGAPTNRALWLLIGGALAAVIGLGGLASSSK